MPCHSRCHPHYSPGIILKDFFDQIYFILVIVNETYLDACCKRLNLFMPSGEKTDRIPNCNNPVWTGFYGMVV